MARRHQPAAAETLEELEGAADRLGDWLEENLRIVIAAVVGVLVLAGAGAWILSARESSAKEASAALAKVRADYLSAMGASPGALDVPELANPQAAAEISSEYRGRFDEVSERYAGTVAATLAAIEAAELARRAEGVEASLARLEQALESAPAEAPLRGMLLQQIAQDLESAERWEDAARRHLQAAELDGYPLAGWALADAARTTAMAGDAPGALALYDRLEAEHPDLRLPDHQRTQVRELRAQLGDS